MTAANIDGKQLIPGSDVGPPAILANLHELNVLFAESDVTVERQANRRILDRGVFRWFHLAASDGYSDPTPISQSMMVSLIDISVSCCIPNEVLKICATYAMPSLFPSPVLYVAIPIETLGCTQTTQISNLCSDNMHVDAKSVVTDTAEHPHSHVRTQISATFHVLDARKSLTRTDGADDVHAQINAEHKSGRTINMSLGTTCSECKRKEYRQSLNLTPDIMTGGPPRLYRVDMNGVTRQVLGYEWSCCNTNQIHLFRCDERSKQIIDRLDLGDRALQAMIGLGIAVDPDTVVAGDIRYSGLFKHKQANRKQWG